jgi:hypothetical protein
MDNRDIIKPLIEGFNSERLSNLLRRIAPAFRPDTKPLDDFIKDDWPFDSAQKLGVIELPGSQTILVGVVHVERELTSRSSKKTQYELGKRILKAYNSNGGIFAFYDDNGRFRLSLITVTYHGTRRQFSTFRRYTFFVEPELPNKTFVNQIGRADFASLENILEAFSLEAVSDAFYQEFKPKFDAIAAMVQGSEDEALQQDFALLFVIRVIFLGFVQKKGWLDANPRFLQSFWWEYQSSGRPKDTFYREWLEPLFFEALSSPPGRKVAYGHAPFSEETQNALQMTPYLNGELFKRKQGVDDQGLWIPDDLTGDFFDFLFQYNFTVEENELYDEELELNPEFLGIIFERITNMDQGAVYTPRVEVDLMCRLALVQWLAQTTDIDKRDLYHLFFREAGTGEAYDEYQKQGDFSSAEIRTLIEKLESVTVCDPAAGSGAFEVGMLQVLEQTLEDLYSRNNTPQELKDKAPTPFERKKAIIAISLYGVEVKRWAVWINHLRLWLTLFVDMPDEFRHSFEPLLPNLTFKVRVGDSLVQRIGGKTFPVHGHANLPSDIKRKITELKIKKRDFFYNRSHDYRPIEQEELAVFRAILDAEIEERRKAIARLKAPKPDTLFDLEPTARDLKEERRIEKRIRELEAEIADLQAQKRSLREDRPFIWSIEFAEIFFDRGGFDIVIGNPPYVRQESISDPNGRLSPADYKEALLEMVRLDFPDYFAKSRAQTDQFKKGRQPSGRSDLYTYFYIRSLRLLNPQGVHVFICSNAWLVVGYGAWLQEFFLRQAPLHLVIDNHARRSFARADVNTVITVASAPHRVPEDHLVRFVAFKQPFEDAVLSENLLAIENATQTLKTDAFRVYPITAAELLAEGSDDGKYVGDKWGGKYLRAPDIFFTILERGRGKLVKLGKIADVVTVSWSRQGHNSRIMYRKPLNEVSLSEPIADVLKSPKDVAKIYVSRDDTIYLLKLESWVTRQLIYAPILWVDLRGDRHICHLCLEEIAFTHNFHGIKPHDGSMVQLLCAVLNSTLTHLLTEVFGRSGLGGGAVRVLVEDLRNTFVLLHPEYIADRKRLLISFSVLSQRPITRVFEECGIDPKSEVPIAEQEPNPLPDRKALDNIDALGLTAEERKEVYRAVCQLVWERISKAKSVRRNG